MHLEGLTGRLQGFLVENRENVRQTVSSVRDLTASLNDVVARTAQGRAAARRPGRCPCPRG